MPIAALARLEQNAHRVAEILGVLAKYGLADWVKSWPFPWIQERITSGDGRPIPDLKVEERLRLTCSELGPTFVKLGQMLGTRPDLVGPAIAAELARLQVAAAADPADTVWATIQAELGQPPSQLFADFTTIPLASASIAQVHRAQLRTGEDVVVKVQHAGIADPIRADLDILAALADLADRHSPQLHPYQPVALVHQFRRTLLRELDFTIERRNLDEFAAHFANDDAVRFPLAYPALSSRRVLTMERLAGILGTDRAALAASGADLDALARRGANMYLQMIFRDAFYHADPHPGNLMLLPDGAIGVVDCGMVGRLDEEMAHDVEEMLMAVAAGRAADLADILERVCSAPLDIARGEFRADLADFVADYTGVSLHDLSLSSALNRLADLLRRYTLVLPAPLSLLLRTLIELEGTAQTLNPRFSLAEVIRPFYAELMQRRLSPRRIWHRMQRASRSWERLLVALPRDLEEVLTRVREGSFSVHLRHRNLDAVVNRLVLGVITAALIVSSALLWSLHAPPIVGGISVFGAAGYLVALYLGGRLVRAIKRSGDLKSNQ
jgi:ubiquinone biosynthesis protein